MKHLVLVALLGIFLIGCSDEGDDTTPTTYDGGWLVNTLHAKDSGNFNITVKQGSIVLFSKDSAMTLFSENKSYSDSSAPITEIEGNALTLWWVNDDPLDTHTVKVSSTFDDWLTVATLDTNIILDELPEIDKVTYKSVTVTPNLAASTVTKTLNDAKDSITLDVTQAYQFMVTFDYETGNDLLPIVPGTATYVGTRTMSYKGKAYNGPIPPAEWPTTIEEMTYDEYWEDLLK